MSGIRRAAWRVALGLVAGLAGAGAARADCDAAEARLLWPDRTDVAAVLARMSDRCVTATAEDGTKLLVVATEEILLFGQLREGAVQATGWTDPITIDPPWTVLLAAAPEALLGPGFPAWRVTYSNSYLSTGRSTGTEVAYLLRRRGRDLLVVLAVLVEASHSEEVACPRNRRPPCRMGWSRRWALEAVGPARPGRPPDLVLRDARTKQVVSRHRWQRDGYVPPVFDRTPPLGPG